MTRKCSWEEDVLISKSYCSSFDAFFSQGNLPRSHHIWFIFLQSIVSDFL